MMNTNEYLNEILSPYEKIIMLDSDLRNQIEEIILKYQFEFDTNEVRGLLKYELEEYITDYIIERRNDKLNKIL